MVDTLQDRVFAGVTLDQARSAIIGATGVGPERLGLQLTTDRDGVKVEAVRDRLNDLQLKALTALHNVSLAAPTTDYGTWGDYHPGGRKRLADTVDAFTEDFPDCYDADGLTRAYHAEINKFLPRGVKLAEDNHFYGPYPVDEELKAGIRYTIDEVDSGIRRLLKEHELEGRRP